MTTTKKYKITTSGYYFTYSNRQHPFYKDQTEKIASLYRKSDNQLISELNTEGDKVHGIDKFTHKETIEWFDSILNPVEIILSGCALIAKERLKQKEKHGFTAKHHANHPELYNENQLIHAAETLLTFNLSGNVFVPKNWNHHWFYNLCKRDYDERLVIAGALIAAEIDRLSFIKKEKSHEQK